MVVEKTDMSVGVREELVMCVDDHQGKLVGLQRSLEIGFCVEGSGSVTSHKSDKCEDVFVCSDYCYSKHVYEDTCLPYRIENSPGLGRYVVATRDILPTELIISEAAAALGPCQNTQPRCLTCLASMDQMDPEKIVWCDKCNFPFCSEQCASSDLHVNNECSAFPYR